ncbi:MAG TPA: SRPBCC family protein [Xanthobacteraceae bacterium]|jgi:uncharacterized protein YndB with AHSA1/START domain|nr:SRPBCC family protein [Xanthobacteraceae bacterium]
MSDKPKFVYVIYIASSPEKVFEALTNPDLTEKYWFGFRVAAAGPAGSTFTARSPGGEKFNKGVILESDPPRRLAYTWHPQYDHDKHERPSRVTFDIESFRGQVRLTIVHDDFDVGSKMFEGISRGWPAVLSSLKSFLESGQTSDPSWFYEAVKKAEEEAQADRVQA